MAIVDFNWIGTEEDGYVANFENLILYVSPISGNIWGWSVTSKSPLAAVSNHTIENTSKKTSLLAQQAAESIAKKYLDIKEEVK